MNEEEKTCEQLFQLFDIKQIYLSVIVISVGILYHIPSGFEIYHSFGIILDQTQTCTCFI